MQKIEDPRLTPDLRRVRSGYVQHFLKPGKRSFIPDFIIQPPEPHIYAELIDGTWYWVNGCDECNGKPGSWMTYIKCETHDVCCSCGIKRSELKEVPLGHPKGFKCKPCAQLEHELEKARALARMPEYDPWDFTNTDKVTCPYCNYEIDDDHRYYDSEDEEVECGRCDNKFIVTAEQSVTFTTKRKEEEKV